MVSSQEIQAKVARCAALFDSKAPGWAIRVPLGSLDVRDVKRSPLAYVIGKDWDEKITSNSAIELGAFTLYTVEGEALNRAWQAEIALRRGLASKAS